VNIYEKKGVINTLAIENLINESLAYPAFLCFSIPCFWVVFPRHTGCIKFFGVFICRKTIKVRNKQPISTLGTNTMLGV
jgi:hypothetical protein